MGLCSQQRLCTCLWGDEMSGRLAVSDTEQVVNKYLNMNEGVESFLVLILAGPVSPNRIVQL